MSSRILLSLFLCVMAGHASGQENATVRIRLWPSAVVMGEQIVLAEICDHHGLDPAIETAIAHTWIATSPNEGGSLEITMDQVQAALTTTSLNTAQVIFEGASRCAVRRPFDPLKNPRRVDATYTEDLTGVDRLKSQSQAQDDGPQQAGEALFQTSTPMKTRMGDGSEAATLRDHIEQWFWNQIGTDQGRLELNFGASIVPYLARSEPEFQFKIESESKTVLGLVNLKVTLVGLGQPTEVLPVAVQAQYWRPHVVAKRSINAKAIVADKDLTIEERRIDDFSQPAPSEPQQLIGLQTRKYIAAGTSMGANLVQPVPLVRRGQLVDVVSTAGGIVIQTTARAASDGTLGARIDLRTTDKRREQLTGVVTGPNRVELRETQPDVREALALNVP